MRSEYSDLLTKNSNNLGKPMILLYISDISAMQLWITYTILYIPQPSHNEPTSLGLELKHQPQPYLHREIRSQFWEFSYIPRNQFSSQELFLLQVSGCKGGWWRESLLSLFCSPQSRARDDPGLAGPSRYQASLWHIWSGFGWPRTCRCICTRTPSQSVQKLLWPTWLP